MYESFYGLKEKPFTLLPDPEYLYLSPKHQRALTLLEYGLMNQAGFSVICGDTGAGKTTLIRRLLSELGDDTCVGLITNTHQSFGELLNWVLMAFGLDGEGKSKAQMHQMFIDFLIKQYAENRHTVLIVDEAQNMSADMLEELRMLSNINADKDQVLQVILAGQPALRKTLCRPELMQFAQRISVDYYLEALSMEETRAYISHRLKVAGAENQIFTNDACDAIYKYSGGTPRLINLLSDTTLVYGFAEQSDRIGELLVHDVVREQHSNSIIPTFNTEQPHAIDNMLSEKPVAKAHAEQPVEVQGEMRGAKPDLKEKPVDEKQGDVIANLAQRAVKAVASADQIAGVTHTQTVPTSQPTTARVSAQATTAKAEGAAENAKVTPIKSKQPMESAIVSEELSGERLARKETAEGELAEKTPARETSAREEKTARSPDEHEPPLQNDKAGATKPEDKAEAEIDFNSIQIEPEETASSFAALDGTGIQRAEDVYPIVHIEENPKKGMNMMLMGLAGGMFIASLAMVVMAWVLFGDKGTDSASTARSAPIDFEAHRENDRREMEVVEKQRDVAIAINRALELERDAAIRAAAAQEKIREAELRAAEILAEQERKAEQELQAVKIRAEEAERAEARVRERERRLRIKAEQKSKELEAQRARERRESRQAKARAEQVREERRLEAARQEQARRDAQRAQQRKAQAVAAREAEAQAVAVKKAAEKSKSFSSNPCNSPSAKFLSTCKK